MPVRRARADDSSSVKHQQAQGDSTCVKHQQGEGHESVVNTSTRCTDASEDESFAFKHQQDRGEEPAMKRPAKRLNTSVVVHVGAENTTFNIPREPICKASGYFRAVFESGDFKETSEKALTLPDYEPETFDQFLSYVYNGRSVDTAPFDVLSAEEKWLRYSILYSLADYLQANRLKNSIVGILYRLCVLTNHNRKPSGITEKVIEYVFDNTVHGCGIRRLMVAQYIWGSKYEAFRQPEALEDLHAAMTGLHEDFLAELAAEAMRRVWDGKTRDPMKAGHRSFEDEEEVKLLSGKK